MHEEEGRSPGVLTKFVADGHCDAVLWPAGGISGARSGNGHRLSVSELGVAGNTGRSQNKKG